MIKISARKTTVMMLHRILNTALDRGDKSSSDKCKAILAVIEGHPIGVVSAILGYSQESVRVWIHAYVLKGVAFFQNGKSTGRPSKLTKKQKAELKKTILDGPQEAGYPGGCWRTPMIQDFIQRRFKVLYSVKYLAELLKSMNLSYQKAKFVSDHKDPKKRAIWLKETWPEIVKIMREKNAHVFFGDEASFPQWGSLSYTWALRGVQPVVKTSGCRKGHKVFGLIEYMTGKFFSKAIDGKFNSESYKEFLKEVLVKTRKHLILIQDGARYHTSKEMKQFFLENASRITVFQMPSYSPDYNPIEKLWKKIKQKGTHLVHFPDFESLKEKVNEMLDLFATAKDEVLALFGFYRELTQRI